MLTVEQEVILASSMIGRIIKNKVTGVISAISTFNLNPENPEDLIDQQYYIDNFYFCDTFEFDWVEWEEKNPKYVFTLNGTNYYTMVQRGYTGYYMHEYRKEMRSITKNLFYARKIEMCKENAVNNTSL